MTVKGTPGYERKLAGDRTVIPGGYRVRLCPTGPQPGLPQRGGRKAADRQTPVGAPTLIGKKKFGRQQEAKSDGTGKWAGRYEEREEPMGREYSGRTMPDCAAYMAPRTQKRVMQVWEVPAGEPGEWRAVAGALQRHFGTRGVADFERAAGEFGFSAASGRVLGNCFAGNDLAHGAAGGENSTQTH
jgi:hypothetical protein